MPPRAAPMAYVRMVILTFGGGAPPLGGAPSGGLRMSPPNLGGRRANPASMRHAHHAVAEALRLQAAGPAPPLALVLLLADRFAAGLLQRGAIVLSLALRRRRLGRSRQRDQRKSKRDRPHPSHQRIHVIAPYIKLA